MTLAQWMTPRNGAKEAMAAKIGNTLLNKKIGKRANNNDNVIKLVHLKDAEVVAVEGE